MEKALLSLRFIKDAPQFIGALPRGTKYTGTRYSGCPFSRARWELARTRFVTRRSAVSNSKKRTKDRFGIWKLLMERTPARKETSRLPNWCSIWAFSNSELSVAILQSRCFQNLSPKGQESVAPRHLPTASRTTEGRRRFIDPAWIFIRFAATSKLISKISRGINQAWIDELIGHESTIRRSEGERYTKQINLPILQRLVNSIRINADLSHLRYAGEARRCGTRTAIMSLHVSSRLQKGKCRRK